MSFLHQSPVSEEEVKEIEGYIRTTIEKVWNMYQTKNNGIKGLYQYLEQQQQQQEQSCSSSSSSFNCRNNTKNSIDQEVSSKIQGDARTYQIEFFHRAIRNNTIVSLGTGQGKTFIAIMTIHHFASDFQTNLQHSNTTTITTTTNTVDNMIMTNHHPSHFKQTWFLVPSIALAVQQANTLRTNLPYTVGIACHTAASSDLAREELGQCQILVATHGAALDLLRHYGDTFHLSRVNLLILDECHNAVKNNNYAVLMKKFYHTLPNNKSRPHVLGLTASPIINVPKNITDDILENRLQELESTLDSSLISFSSLNLCPIEAGLLISNVQERIIHYHNIPPPVVSFNHTSAGLHPSRYKELDQLNYLYYEFGPALVASYCEVLTREISQNKYEKETINQFQALKLHLMHICNTFKSQYSNQKENDGKSDKMIALERLLVDLYSLNHNYNNYNNGAASSIAKDTVGIVFVERRISALALKHFLTFHSNIHMNSHHPIKCDLLTRQTSHIFKYLSPHHHQNNISLKEQQQKQAHDDWLHKIQSAKEVLDMLRRREINLLFCTSVVEEGVDVDACSFVIVLDDLKTTKSYIQMKGRARQLNAQFHVFENSESQTTPPVTLSHAQHVETKITNYIGMRTISKSSSTTMNDSTHQSSFYASSEEDAIHQGEYRAKYGMVDLASSKSLVNRYAFCVPMDSQ